jgi:alpha-amylase
MFAMSKAWSVCALEVLLLAITVLTFIDLTQAATMSDWRSRSIYQLFTDRFALSDGSWGKECNAEQQLYCGGSFQGIINKLDYIQGMGFTAIWISPIIKNINDTGSFGQAYHGFWSQDITQINEHFGTADDLKALSKAVHDRGMYLMIDVVANNMAAAGTAAGVDYSKFVPFNSKQYFHDVCSIQDWSSSQVQNCWLATDIVSLADLKSEDTFVQQTFNKWGQDVIQNYGVDGFRIDAAKHVQTSFWTSFQNATNVFTIGEVFDYSTENICDYTHSLNSVLNFPIWTEINATFTNNAQSMKWLGYAVGEQNEYCQDPTTLGLFSENHDVSRLGSWTQDWAMLANALTFTIFGDGIPIVYYGSEQGYSGGKDPMNREALWLSYYNTTSPLYLTVAAANTARNLLSQNTTYQYWSPYWTLKSKILMMRDEVIAIRKGYDRSVLAITTNRGASAPQLGPYTLNETNWLEGETVVELLTCNTMTVGQYGQVTVTIPKGGQPMVSTRSFLYYIKLTWFADLGSFSIPWWLKILPECG